MGLATMGKVLVKARVENIEDLFAVGKGFLQPSQVRSAEVDHALVGTGASTLSLPGRVIQQLGLKFFRTRQVRTTAGPAEVRMCGVVRLTIQGREGYGDVIELPDDCPVLIGQLPLEGLDFVIDTVSQKLIGNPAHGGEHIMELY